MIGKENTMTRKYETPIYDGDLYDITEWEEMVDRGEVMDDDGSGRWVKDGKMARHTDVFIDPQMDATHVVWFNK